MSILEVGKTLAGSNSPLQSADKIDGKYVFPLYNSTSYNKKKSKGKKETYVLRIFFSRDLKAVSVACR